MYWGDTVGTSWKDKIDSYREKESAENNKQSALKKKKKFLESCRDCIIDFVMDWIVEDLVKEAAEGRWMWCDVF